MRAAISERGGTIREQRPLAVPPDSAHASPTGSLGRGVHSLAVRDRAGRSRAPERQNSDERRFEDALGETRYAVMRFDGERVGCGSSQRINHLVELEESEVGTVLTSSPKAFGKPSTGEQRVLNVSWSAIWWCPPEFLSVFL